MLSAEEIILEYVSPLLGVVVGSCMFFAPVQDCLKATSKTGSLGDLNPTPWAFMTGNCIGWVTYGILTRNFFVYMGNCPSMIMSVWLNLSAAKLQYENHKVQEMRSSMVNALERESSKHLEVSTNGFIREEQIGDADEQPPSKAQNKKDEEQGSHGVMDFARVVWDVTAQHKPVPAPHERLFLGIISVWVAIISVVGFGDAFSQQTKEYIVGIAVNLNLVFFYGAPLSTIATVLRTQSTASIHIPTMIMNTANGTFWFIYGLAVMDLFIGAPNGAGALLGVIQVILCFIFPRKGKEIPSQTEEEND